MKNAPFNEVFWDHFKNDRLEQALREAINYGESLLTQDTTALTKKISAKHSLKPLTLNFNDVEKNIVDIDIPAERFPRGYHVYSGKVYTMQAGMYRFTYTGDYGLLKIKMEYGNVSFYDIYYDNNAITIKITNFNKLDGNEESLKIVKTAFEATKSKLLQMTENLNKNVSIFNEQLPSLIANVIETEVTAINKRKDSIDKL